MPIASQGKRGPWRTAEAWSDFDIEKAVAKLRAVSPYGLFERELFYKGKAITSRCSLTSEWATFFQRDSFGRRLPAKVAS